jgi:hypothetical protein
MIDICSGINHACLLLSVSSTVSRAAGFNLLKVVVEETAALCIVA